MAVHVDSAVPSTTAVIAGPMDLSRLSGDLDAVHAFLATRPDIRQTGHDIALYEHGERMEIGVEVAEPFESDGPVVCSELPGGRVVHATHTTGYDDLSRTYALIGDWCDEHRHAAAGIQWEIYGDPDPSGHVDVEVCSLLV